MVLAGIECSPKIFDFRASGIPVQEHADFFDTLNHLPNIRQVIFTLEKRLKCVIMKYYNGCRMPIISALHNKICYLHVEIAPKAAISTIYGCYYAKIFDICRFTVKRGVIRVVDEKVGCRASRPC